MPTGFTDDEVQISEAYICVLDFVSRCALAVDEDNFYYLWDKVGQLESAAKRLHEILGESKGRPRVRAGVVHRAVAAHGRYYDACRLLHPPSNAGHEGGR